jgi:LysR family glycine cleavage system transcriptional activator
MSGIRRRQPPPFARISLFAVLIANYHKCYKGRAKRFHIGLCFVAAISRFHREKLSPFKRFVGYARITYIDANVVNVRNCLGTTMSDRVTSLLALRAFEAAARRLSFTDAAHELHVSQAAISRHVRVLEADLGRPLFRRLHRQVELTAPGKQLAGELTAGFSRIGRAVEAVRSGPPRRLRISVEPAFAARWLVPRFGRFTAAHPEIEVDLESSDELRTVGRDADIAIRFIPSASRKPIGRARRLFTYTSSPVIASRIRTNRLKRRSDGDILAFRLLHDDDGSEWLRWFAAAGLDGFDSAKHIHFNDSSLALTAVLRGQGVALTAPFYVRSQLRSGRLVRIGRTSVTFGDYWLLEATDRATVKARAAFIEWFDLEARSLFRTQAGTPPSLVKLKNQ